MYIAISNSIGASSRVNGGGGGGSFTNKYSLALDGVDDKVQFSSISLGADYTLSAWAKRTSTANMFLFGNAQTYGYGAYFNGTSALYYKETTLVTFNNVAIQTALARTDWVNWVFKKDSGAGTMAVYVDGVLAQSVTTGNGMSTITTIGASGLSTGTQYVWSGNIDEVSIFNTSAIDLADLGSTTTPKDLSAISGLTNWYRNGDNGTWASPQWLIPSNENKDKVSNYSFDFDGIDDYIDCGEIPPLFKYYPIGTAKDNTWSASMWVKGSTSGGFFEIPYIQSNSLNAFSFGFLFGGSYLYFGGKYAQIKMKETGTTAYSITNWNHIVMTFDGIDHTALSSYTLYVGGVPIVMELIAVNLADYRTENISIGVAGSDGSPSYWDGNIDEVSLFGIELTQPQVTDIYNSGTPTTLPSGAVAHYKMGEGSIFTNNWLVDNSATTAYSTRSFNFDGVDDYINTGVSALDGATSFTLSTWVNTSYNDWQNLFGDNSFRLALKQSINRIDITFNGVVVQQASDFTLTLGQWHHIAITFDASLTQIDRIKVYLDDFRVNNLLVGTTATSYIANNNFMIGRVGTQITKEWNGSIDEFATFNSVQNITDLYNGGTPTTITGATNWWRMGEDASFNTNWNVPDQVGSATGTSANMTIGDLTGEAPNYTGGGTSANMTLEDRLGEAPNSSNNAVSLNMDEVDRETDVPA